MNRQKSAKFILAAIGIAAFLFISETSKASVAGENATLPQYSNGTFNLSFPEESQDLKIIITSLRSKSYGWAPGQKVRLSAFVEHANGQKQFLRDRQGKALWELLLDSRGQGLMRVSVDEKSFTGKLVILANGKELYEPVTDSSQPAGRWTEKIYEYRFNDGARLKVHYTDQGLETFDAAPDLASQVLDAAVMAYQTITEFEGFNTLGYSFASPNKKYAYDPDKTIDIYLGQPTGENGYEGLGARNRMFRDAPCFDTIQLSDTQYQAVILLPANYREFIKNWEKINPSSLGKRNIHVDLRGTLIHEMLHVVLFYYNKNLNKSSHEHAPGLSEANTFENTARDLDWYVEGLARYFETFAGARHDFYSQGFKQTFADKIRFSRGGSNYFMRYPDQTFVGLRYENAIFWRFMDYRYGMGAIEMLSRNFRKEGANFKEALEQVTGQPFNELLQKFSLAVLLKDFGLKEDEMYLNEIAKTQLRYRQGAFYLLDGRGHEKFLGKRCATDWIGAWEGMSAVFGNPSVAGDNTEESDVSSWATDFYEIKLDVAVPELPQLKLSHHGMGSPLYLQVACFSKGGSMIHAAVPGVASQHSYVLDLKALISQNALEARDIDKIYLLVTNSDARRTAPYDLEIQDLS